MERKPWPRGITLPIILIMGGIALLAGNLLGWNMWDFLIRMWPVWLIAVGLDILFGRGSRVGAIAVSAAVMLILVGGMWFYSLHPTVRNDGGGEPLTTGAIDQPLGGATEADITISPSVGQLRIYESDDPTMLVTGTVYRLVGETVNKSATMRTGTTASYSLKSNLVSPMPFGPSRRGRWELGLTNAVPLNLIVNTGVGEATLDLTHLNVRTMELHTGVGQVTVNMPRQGQLRATMNTGVGQAVVLIPAGVAARIVAHTGIGALHIEGEYQRSGETYLSPGYDTATNRIDLEVSGGIGEVRVLRGN